MENQEKEDNLFDFDLDLEIDFGELESAFNAKELELEIPELF